MTRSSTVHRHAMVAAVSTERQERALRVRKQLIAAVDRRRIAIIPLKGVIGGAVKTTDAIRMLDRAGADTAVRAVVLDIDSPGGAAVASEAIYRAVARVAHRKPVVAWIRGVGASGSYFAACGATKITAFPAAIVGSIGVISVRPVAVEALKKLGLQIMVTKTGPFKDLGAPWREPNDEDRAKEQQLVDAILTRFGGVVGKARNLEGDALARVMTGEVWLAEAAVPIGLVDAIFDTEEEVVAEARRLAGVPDSVRTVRMGPRKTVMQHLGVPGAGMGMPGVRWIIELEGWLSLPRL